MANNIKIRNVEQLEEYLFEDLAWRKKEMLSLKLLIESAEGYEPILLRAGIALLCAHFEGFIKKASNCYMGYVAEQRIQFRLLNNSFSAWEIQKEFKSCSKSEKNSVHTRLLNKYEALGEKRFADKYYLDQPYISTHSNPNVDELKEIMSTLGIKTNIFETKANYINKDLLENRHKVVHGEKVEFEKTDFLNTFDIIMELIDAYSDLIIQSSQMKKYMKCELLINGK